MATVSNMRHYLASLLRRLADRLYPDDLITMTITDSAGKVKRSSWRGGVTFGADNQTTVRPMPYSVKNSINYEPDWRPSGVRPETDDERRNREARERAQRAMRDYALSQGAVADPPAPIPPDDPPGYTEAPIV